MGKRKIDEYNHKKSNREKFVKWEGVLKKIVYFFNYFVFLAATLAIAGVFYEGMEQKWFDLVGIFILFMDYSFLLSTILNIIVERKSKWIYIHTFSLVILIIAIAMKLLNIAYPSLTLVLWYFYIWFLYGIRIVNYYLKYKDK